LVIHGTADKTVPIDATAREVAAKVPHALIAPQRSAPAARGAIFACRT
jgi:hypothetical protein